MDCHVQTDCSVLVVVCHYQSPSPSLILFRLFTTICISIDPVSWWYPPINSKNLYWAIASVILLGSRELWPEFGISTKEGAERSRKEKLYRNIWYSGFWWISVSRLSRGEAAEQCWPQSTTRGTAAPFTLAWRVKNLMESGVKSGTVSHLYANVETNVQIRSPESPHLSECKSFAGTILPNWLASAQHINYWSNRYIPDLHYNVH